MSSERYTLLIHTIMTTTQDHYEGKAFSHTSQTRHMTSVQIDAGEGYTLAQADAAQHHLFSNRPPGSEQIIQVIPLPPECN